MPIINMHEAKTHLSRLVQASLEGQEVIIAKGNKPLVKLVPIPPVVSERKLGNANGLIIEMADDFDAPMDDFEEYM